MNKIKLSVTLIVATAFIAVLGVHAQSNKELQPKKVKQKAASVQLKDKPNLITPAVSEPKAAPVSIPQTTPFKGSRQGYLMVTDVLDGFGGESESDNYRIPVNSGGQPSAIGASASATFVIRAGFVHASQVKRGDANADGVIDLGDIVYLLNYLFKGDVPPRPIESGDINCDGVIDLGDIVHLLNYLFKGGPAPTC